MTMGKVKIDIKYDEKLCFALQQYSFSTLKKITITNIGNEKLEHLKLKITCNPTFSKDLEIEIPIIEVDHFYSLENLSLDFFSNFFYSLDESLKGKINISLENELEQLYETTLNVELLSYDSWPGLCVIPEILASFVTPNRTAILDIIKEASDLYNQTFRYSSFDGYQSGDPNKVIAMLSSIYSVIQSKNISYCVPPASFQDYGQKIRFPETILNFKLATCLDSTLLYVACAEAIGINSLIVLLDGHALPGFWLIESNFRNSVEYEANKINNRLADGVNEVIVVESTYLTNQLPFDSARASAIESLNKERNFELLIDVKRARQLYIKPLPARKLINDSYELEKTDEKINPEFAAVNPYNIQFVEGKNVFTRIDVWQKGLLDLSLRNNLINFREKTGLTIINRNIGDIEDHLATGNSFEILPRPNMKTNGIDLDKFIKENNGQQLYDSILSNDFKNNQLHTNCQEDELTTKVMGLYRRSRSNLEESGVNTLFLAIGFLKWKDKTANYRYAPVVLMPITIYRSSIKSNFQIKGNDEEAFVNITLIEFLKEYGINASSLEQAFHEEKGIDINYILFLLRKFIMDKVDWSVEETISIGIFSFSKFVMWNDLKNRRDLIEKNKVVSALMTNQIKMDEEVSSDQKIFTPLNYDSSQLNAILESSKNKTFILQGPPGTGKSQTITNIIASSLANNKKVLFVAEKLAALTVVQRRLSNVGLQDYCLELHSNKTNKKAVLKQLEQSVNSLLYDSNEEFYEKKKNIDFVSNEIEKYIEVLHQKRNIGLSIYQGISLYSNLHEFLPLIPFNENELYEEKYTDVLSLLEQFLILEKTSKEPYEHVFYGVNLEEVNMRLKDDIVSIINKIIYNNECNQELYQKMEHQLITLKLNNHLKSYELLVKILELYFIKTKAKPEFIHTDDFDGAVKQIDNTIKLVKERNELREELQKIFDLDVLSLDIKHLLLVQRQNSGKWFLPRFFTTKGIINKIKLYILNKKQFPKNKLLILLDKLNRVKEINEILKNEVSVMTSAFGEFYQNGNCDVLELEGHFNWLIKYHNYIADLSKLSNTVNEVSTYFVNLKMNERSNDNNLLKQYAKEFNQFLNDYHALKKVLKVTYFDFDEQTNCYPRIIKKLNLMKDHINDLNDYCKVVKVKNEMNSLGFKQVVRLYFNGQIMTNQLIQVFNKSYLRIWIDKEINREPILKNFTKDTFIEKIKRLKRIDDEYMALTRNEIKAKISKQLPDMSIGSQDNSESGFIMKAIGNKGRGLTIRKIYEKSKNILPILKPCMLMSPLSVAQYLDRDYPLFDLVIFDEASQIKTAEAIGALSRGKNAIIVGDNKQLPPTTFFQQTDNEEYEDINMIDSENILDECIAIGIPQKSLLWHYRSTHESLISFSNLKYYDNRLITFPSFDNNDCKVAFKKVNGIYDKGRTRYNIIEANYVVDEIFHRLKNKETCKQTIGVVTFNVNQQAIIEDIIEKRLKIEPDLYHYFYEDEESVFVKNIESVQGDERDVIIFSVGFGPTKKGKIYMNFGPLNQGNGSKRLNVAISRSKVEMIIYSSLNPEDIDLSRTQSEGVKDFKMFLEYARSRNLIILDNISQEESKNDLINYIKSELKKSGYDANVNIGNSKCKIDIGVLKPNSSSYILGILCDGDHANDYHSIRDREKLKEEMLSKLGWNLIRVYSISFFHNPKREMEHIIKEIQEIILGNKMIVEECPIIYDDIILEKNHESKIEYQSLSIPKVNFDSSLFYETKSLKHINKQVKEIVEYEAPVQFNLLCKKIAQSWGLQQTGKRIKEIIYSQIVELEYFENESNELVFIWKKDQIHNFSYFRVNNNEFKRETNEISNEEYSNAILFLLEHAISIQEDNLIIAVSRLIGFSKLGSNLNTIIRNCVKNLLFEQKIIIDADGNIALKK